VRGIHARRSPATCESWLRRPVISRCLKLAREGRRPQSWTCVDRRQTFAKPAFGGQGTQKTRDVHNLKSEVSIKHRLHPCVNCHPTVAAIVHHSNCLHPCINCHPTV
jgi:hypothetical protein